MKFVKNILIVFLLFHCSEGKKDPAIMGALAITDTTSGTSSDSSSTSDSSTSSSTTSSSGSSSSTEITLTKIALGDGIGCVLFSNGKVKCWGKNDSGQLGYGNTTTIGDTETIDSVSYVSVGGTVRDIYVGSFVCVILSDESVKCWGKNDVGQLGYGNTNTIGDDEVPSSVGTLNVAASVTSATKYSLAIGLNHACMIYNSGSRRDLRCWGKNNFGQLGYSNTTDLSSPGGDVNIGGEPSKIVAGLTHTCSIRTDGTVICWGEGSFGKLGYSSIADIGDDETPDTAGAISIGAGRTATEIVTGIFHTCALLDDGNVRCWGLGTSGRLGYGNMTTIGDNETPASAGPVNFGGATAVSISAKGITTCVKTNAGTMMCWGKNDVGQLGQGNTNVIGDNEDPVTVNWGSGTLSQALVGIDFTCSLSTSTSINSKAKCWGTNSNGELGRGNTTVIGDDETPTSLSEIIFMSSSELAGYLYESLPIKNLISLLIILLFGILISVFFYFKKES